MNIEIRVQYLGVIRLLLNKKEEIFSFEKMPTLGELIHRIGGRYGEKINKECKAQAFYLYLPNAEQGKQLRFSEDIEYFLEDGSLVKIISMITGG